MSIFKQRHVKMAMIVAPFLAIGAYFLTGAFITATLPSQTDMPVVTLQVTQPCQLLHAPCAGKSEDGKVRADFQIMSNETPDTVTFEFVANRPLSHAIVQVHPKSPPHLMDDHGAGKWQIRLDKRYLNEMKSLNFAAQHEKALYVAELNYR